MNSMDLIICQAQTIGELGKLLKDAREEAELYRKLYSNAAGKEGGGGQ